MGACLSCLAGCLADCLGALLAHVLRFALTVVIFVLYCIACGEPVLETSTLLATQRNATFANGTLGVSLMDAGIGVAVNRLDGTTYQSTVTWKDLNTQNVCNPSQAIFQQWSRVVGCCVAEKNGTSYTYAKPAEVGTQQSLVLVSTALSAVLLLVYLWRILCDNICMKVLSFVCLLLLISFGAAAFSTFDTLPIASQLQSAKGGVVPMFSPEVKGLLIPSPQAQFFHSKGYNLLVASFAFSVVLFGLQFITDFSTCRRGLVSCCGSSCQKLAEGVGGSGAGTGKGSSSLPSPA